MKKHRSYLFNFFYNISANYFVSFLLVQRIDSSIDPYLSINGLSDSLFKHSNPDIDGKFIEFSLYTSNLKSNELVLIYFNKNLIDGKVGSINDINEREKLLISPNVCKKLLN